jgi:hypothetical protein
MVELAELALASAAQLRKAATQGLSLTRSFSLANLSGRHQVLRRVTVLLADVIEKRAHPFASMEEKPVVRFYPTRRVGSGTANSMRSTSPWPGQAQA